MPPREHATQAACLLASMPPSGTRPGVLVLGVLLPSSASAQAARRPGNMSPRSMPLKQHASEPVCLRAVLVPGVLVLGVLQGTRSLQQDSSQEYSAVFVAGSIRCRASLRWTKGLAPFARAQSSWEYSSTRHHASQAARIPRIMPLSQHASQPALVPGVLVLGVPRGRTPRPSGRSQGRRASRASARTRSTRESQSRAVPRPWPLHAACRR
jgi:hypothetical protein